MNLKDYHFYCPKCNFQLDKDEMIHLKTKRLNGEIGKIFLSTTFGTYSYKHEPKTVFLKNELVDFICKECDSSLISQTYNEFACLKMKVEGKFDFEILFSRKASDHKTYIVTEDGVEFIDYGLGLSRK